MLFDDLEEQGVEEEDRMVILHYEDGSEFGSELEFLFLDLMEYEGLNYVVLLPMDEDENEVTILQIEKDENKEFYLSIEDEELIETLYQIFKEKFRDEFDFIEE